MTSRHHHCEIHLLLHNNAASHLVVVLLICSRHQSGDTPDERKADKLDEVVLGMTSDATIDDFDACNAKPAANKLK